MLRETRKKNPKQIKQPLFRFNHNTVSQEVEDAAYEGLIKIAYLPKSLSDTRNYGVKLTSLEDRSILRYLRGKRASFEEIFIPDRENKFRVFGRISHDKATIKRIERLNNNVQSYQVSGDKLDKFFHMCGEVRKGNASPEDVIRMLN